MTEQPSAPGADSVLAVPEPEMIGEDGPQALRVEILDYDPAWPELFAVEAGLVREVLGDRVLRLEHAGSTSVPGLAGKPIIDMVLEVADADDEAAYLDDLLAAGYRLRAREPQWFGHRLLRGPGVLINLHVFGAGCPEAQRMVAFRDRLRDNPADREHYQREKRALAAREWASAAVYAAAKADVIDGIGAERTCR